MKRDPPSTTTHTKRPRSPSQDNEREPDASPNTVHEINDPFRPTLQRKVVDICDHGLDEEGFIQAQVSMKWPDKPLIQASAVENGQTVKFDIAFLGPCPDYFKRIGLLFELNDSFYLSLKGAQLERKTATTTGHLPVALNYTTGVRLKFIVRNKTGSLASGSIVDYWASLEQTNSEPPRKKRKLGSSTGDATFGDDWFVTPAEPAPHDVAGGEKVVPAESEVAEGSEASEEVAEALVVEEPQSPAPTTTEKPADDSPALPASPATVPSLPPPPPRRLYRDIPGRPRRGDANGRSKQTTPAPSTKGSNKPEGSPSSAQPTEGDAPKEPSKHAAKKAQKKAAREAKKALQLASTVGTTEGSTSEQAPTRETTPHRPNEQETVPSAPVSEVQPARQSLPQTIEPPVPSPHPQPVPGPSKTEAPISSRQNSSVAVAGPSRRIGAPAVTSTTHKPVSAAAPTAPQTKRPLAGAPPAGQNSQLELEAGCVGQNGIVYGALNNLREGPHFNVIGIVASAPKESKTSTGEWCRRLILADPSNVEPEALDRGFSVNCFGKTPTALPQCKVGDVIILRDMQVVAYQGKPSGTCASYAVWTWHVFVPESGKIIREASAPSSSQDLAQSELKYCIALGDWWRAVQKEQERKESNVIRHQIGDADSVGGSQRGKRSIAREHRLIQDATPDVHPNGYFDCTVEILHAHTNNNDRVHSVYVTDYTKNEHVTPVTAAWCPAALAPYVLRLEMWEDAAALGREIQAHEYFQFDNVKMRRTPAGYWEAKFVESRKARKLDTDELEGEPHLASLLERKKKWEEEVDKHGAHKFPHQLIAEAQLDSHFCCTVEILCVKKKDEERTLIWVTDYTSRSDLAPVDATAEWRRNISDDRILKLALRDEQAKVAGDLLPGDIIAVRNLRIKSLSSGKPSVTGLLGGFERLIFKLNPQTTGDEGCLALLSRKKAYEKRAKDQKLQDQITATKGKKRAIMSKKKQAPSNLPDNAWLIKDMKETRDSSKPAKYQVVARVVDYYPDSIENFVILRCTNCEDNIPENLQICTRCETDMSGTYVRPYYKFWLDVEDTQGTRLRLVVAHPELRRRGATTQNLPDFIQDLEPVDFRSEDDETALDKLKDRLRTYLGDELVDKHSDLVHSMDDDGVQPSDSPWLDLIVTVTPGEDPTYLLWKCALLK